MELQGVEYRFDRDRYPEGMVVLEVPFSAPPRAWFATDRAHFVRLCQLRWGREDLSDYDDLRGLPAFDYWGRINAHTLKHQEIYPLAEAIDAIALEAFGWEPMLELLRGRGVLTPVERATK